MKLRHIQTTSFVSSEATMYTALCVDYPHLAKLGERDVVLFRSKTGNQLLFVHGMVNVGLTEGGELYALHSERLRLPPQRPWNPLMLANYAREVGIELEGVKTFEQHLAHLTTLDVTKKPKAARASRRKARKS